MTEEQYNEVVKYRGIIETFVSHGTYIGGATALMDYYKLDQSEKSCQTCVAAFLITRSIELEQYEHSNL